jgi:hypothetical protein
MSLSQLKCSAQANINNAYQSDFQTVMNDVYQFVGLPNHDLDHSEQVPKNTRDYTAMEIEV